VNFTPKTTGAPIIGLDVGAAETEAFWREFLRGLVARGLSGVQLAISDAHPGLKAALATVLGAPWQRCTVHFLRDLRGHVRKDQHDALGAIIRSIFTAEDGEQARRRLRDAVEQLERRLPKIAALLEEAEDDVLAFYACPAEHWPKLRSTNPLERFNREIARRTDVVGIFPDDASLIRLVSMLAIEANDEWLVGRSYISQKSMATLSNPDPSEISLSIKKRRSSSSPPDPRTTSPTSRAPSYTTSWDLTVAAFRCGVRAAAHAARAARPDQHSPRRSAKKAGRLVMDPVPVS
jgi:hypothetical protein